MGYTEADMDAVWRRLGAGRSAKVDEMRRSIEAIQARLRAERTAALKQEALEREEEERKALALRSQGATEGYFKARQLKAERAEQNAHSLQRKRLYFQHGYSRDELKGLFYGLLQDALSEERGKIVCPIWLPEYDEIVDWLTDNQGLGLLLIGTTGLGKTLISEQVLPYMIHYVSHFEPAYCRAVDLLDHFERLGISLRQMGARVHIVDDIGKEEAVYVRSRGGQRLKLFYDLVDLSERLGFMIVANTNLSSRELRDQYDDRLLDRLGGLMRVVHFSAHHTLRRDETTVK